MLNSLRCILIMICIFLQACQHQEENDVPQNPKKDLSKAASYNLQLGLGYLKQGDRPRAKKKLLTALEQAPKSPDVNSALAYYFEKTKELDKAKSYYLKAVDLSDNSGAQLNNYGTFLCRQGEYKKAETYFLKAVKDVQYVHTSGAYENAGLCALEIPDDAKAKDYFIAALNQDPSRSESLYELVKLESKAGRHVEALDLLQKYPDLVLNDKIFLSLAKDIATKAGKPDIALAYDKKLNIAELDNSGVTNEYDSHNG